MKLLGGLAMIVALGVIAAGAVLWSTRLPDTTAFRRQLHAAVQPIAVKNCTMQRFGEDNDGGYLLCANLLGDAESIYSYGIAGYDKLGCDLSSAMNVPVHRYDCFDVTDPLCPTGKAIFHAECVGSTSEIIDGRVFDSVANHVRKNGDSGKRLIVKMDIEGAEWDSLDAIPDALLAAIDQLAMEIHVPMLRPQLPIVGRRVPLTNAQPVVLERHVKTLERLRQHFVPVNIHYNNYACLQGFEPLPASAFQVLFVKKALVEIDPGRQPALPNPLDRPDLPSAPDCRIES